MKPPPGNRFVILHHAAPAGEHWDLMLERGDTLATWQLLTEPTGRDACPIDCVRIGEHRKRYLAYEGPIGGGRGEVKSVERGTYEHTGGDEADWEVTLAGERLQGRFRLRRVDPADPVRWVLEAF